MKGLWFCEYARNVHSLWEQLTAGLKIPVTVLNTLDTATFKYTRRLSHPQQTGASLCLPHSGAGTTVRAPGGQLCQLRTGVLLLFLRLPQTQPPRSSTGDDEQRRTSPHRGCPERVPPQVPVPPPPERSERPPHLPPAAAPHGRPPPANPCPAAVFPPSESSRTARRPIPLHSGREGAPGQPAGLTRGRRRRAAGRSPRTAPRRAAGSPGCRSAGRRPPGSCSSAGRRAAPGSSCPAAEAPGRAGAPSGSHGSSADPPGARHCRSIYLSNLRADLFPRSAAGPVGGRAGPERGYYVNRGRRAGGQAQLGTGAGKFAARQLERLPPAGGRGCGAPAAPPSRSRPPGPAGPTAIPPRLRPLARLSLLSRGVRTCAPKHPDERGDVLNTAPAGTGLTCNRFVQTRPAGGLRSIKHRTLRQAPGGTASVQSVQLAGNAVAGSREQLLLCFSLEIQRVLRFDKRCTSVPQQSLF